MPAGDLREISRVEAWIELLGMKVGDLGGMSRAGQPFEESVEDGAGERVATRMSEHGEQMHRTIVSSANARKIAGGNHPPEPRTMLEGESL